ncbi:MAG: FkbM family methyltransferase [Fluviicola sp.]
MSIPQRSFLLRHQLMAKIRNWDIRGVRRLAAWLPKVLIPNADKQEKHELQTIHGVRLLIDPAKDKGVELALFLQGTYEEGTVHFLQQALKPGDTFLDIGANIGWMTLVGARAVGQGGRVIAIEANPHTLPILQHNVELNQADCVEIYGIAVSDKPGTARLYENWNVNRGGASLLAQDETEGIEVPVETLDRLFDPETPVHVVKIDVEGLEPHVLRGGKNWFTKQQPIFIFEISAMREQEKGASGQDVLEVISQFGNYQFWKHPATKERRGKLQLIRSENDLPEHDNLIAIPRK